MCNISCLVARGNWRLRLENQSLQRYIPSHHGKVLLPSNSHHRNVSQEELLRVSSQLLSLEPEVERLGSEVERLEREGEREREGLAAEKREALEK